MNSYGSVEEDDLILYAMQALSPAEMDGIARRLVEQPELRVRLEQVESVLGLYGAATSEEVEVPAASLDRLLGAVAAERPVASPVVEARPAAERPDGQVRGVRTAGAVRVEKPSWGWRWGLLWAGWAVAALLLVGLLTQFRQSHRERQEVASTETSLRTAQSQASDAAAQASAAQAERDRLQSTVQQQSGDLAATQKAAEDAKNQAGKLNAKAA